MRFIDFWIAVWAWSVVEAGGRVQQVRTFGVTIERPMTTVTQPRARTGTRGSTAGAHKCVRAPSTTTCICSGDRKRAGLLTVSGGAAPPEQ